MHTCEHIESLVTDAGKKECFLVETLVLLRHYRFIMIFCRVVYLLGRLPEKNTESDMTRGIDCITQFIFCTLLNCFLSAQCQVCLVQSP